MSAVEPIMLTVKDVQTMLNIGKNTAYELIAQPDFPTIKLGGKYLVSKQGLEAWVQKHLYKEYTL